MVQHLSSPDNLPPGNTADQPVNSTSPNVSHQGAVARGAEPADQPQRCAGRAGSAPDDDAGHQRPGISVRLIRLRSMPQPPLGAPVGAPADVPPVPPPNRFRRSSPTAGAIGEELRFHTGSRSLMASTSCAHALESRSSVIGRHGTTRRRRRSPGPIRWLAATAPARASNSARRRRSSAQPVGARAVQSQHSVGPPPIANHTGEGHDGSPLRPRDRLRVFRHQMISPVSAARRISAVIRGRLRAAGEGHGPTRPRARRGRPSPAGRPGRLTTNVLARDPADTPGQGWMCRHLWEAGAPDRIGEAGDLVAENVRGDLK